MNNAPTQLRAWLKSEGRMVNWLAAQIPANASSVSQWLNGARTPNGIYRKRLAEISGLPISDKEAWK